MLLEHVDHLYAPLQDLVMSLPQAVPDPGAGEAPKGVGEKVLILLKWIAWLATAACVAGLIATAGKMAIAHRRGDDTNVSQLGWVLAACIILGSAASIVGALL